MTRQRIVIIGAGLCGSVLAARLRNRFEITVVEQARKKRPLYHEITCADGGINSSINRAAGLGGTSNYWHNALIELATTSCAISGSSPGISLRSIVRHGHSSFRNRSLPRATPSATPTYSALPPGRVAHMVVPQVRVNLWEHAQQPYPGDPVSVVYGHAERLIPGTAGNASHALVQTENGPVELHADHYILCAGGLATPVLLASSLGVTRRSPRRISRSSHGVRCQGTAASRKLAA